METDRHASISPPSPLILLFFLLSLCGLLSLFAISESLRVLFHFFLSFFPYVRSREDIRLVAFFFVRSLGSSASKGQEGKLGGQKAEAQQFEGLRGLLRRVSKKTEEERRREESRDALRHQRSLSFFSLPLLLGVCKNHRHTQPQRTRSKRVAQSRRLKKPAPHLSVCP